MIRSLSFISPSTRQPLTKAPDGSALLGRPDERYPLIDGIPQLLIRSAQALASSESQAYYRDRASEYDRGIEGAGRGWRQGIAPWLANSEFAKILENSNPLFRHRAPLEPHPGRCAAGRCRWIHGGAFYLIGFVKGQGKPPLDLDVEFPGRRGGSHRTRYLGKLEGVSPELRDQVLDAVAAEGISVVAWLEGTLGRAIQNAAHDGVDD